MALTDVGQIGSVLSELRSQQTVSQSQLEKTRLGSSAEEGESASAFDQLLKGLSDMQGDADQAIDLLVKGNHNTFFVYLKGDFDLIHARMQDRCGHYMKADMLRSQFDALEEPSNALVVDINQNIDHITAEVTGFISKICFNGSLQHRS